MFIFNEGIPQMNIPGSVKSKVQKPVTMGNKCWKNAEILLRQTTMNLFKPQFVYFIRNWP